MQVFCYRNLHYPGVVWSVKNRQTGLVVDRSSVVILKDCLLKVSQAGRARVLRDKRKHVHAGVSGTRIDTVPNGIMRRVTYNPYKTETFVYCDTGLPVLSAQFVILNDTGCHVIESI